MSVGIIDINFFEGQARRRFNPKILGEEPYVVANVPHERIVSLNESSKNYGLNRHYKLSDALSQVPNLQIIPIPLNNHGQPIRKKLEIASRDFYYCLKNTRDENNWDIPIEYGSPDEAFLDLSNQVDIFMSNNSTPYIYSNALHWNSYFEIGDQQIFMSQLKMFGENKKNLSQNYPEVYYSALIMTKFMRKLENYQGLQVSAGLGEDRFFAKLASELNNSNSLTYLSRDAFDRLSEDLNINQIVGLKGRTGDDIKNIFDIETVAELREISFGQLKNALYGDRDKTLEIRQKIFGNLPYCHKDNWPIEGMVFNKSFKF